MHRDTWADLLDTFEGPRHRTHSEKCRTCPVAALCVTENYTVFITHCEGCGLDTLIFSTSLLGSRDILITRADLIACVAACGFARTYTQTCKECSAGEMLQRMKGAWNK